MTGTEVALLMGLVGMLGISGGRFWGQKTIEAKYLTKDRHELLCNNATLRFEKKLDITEKAIIKAIKENGKCPNCQGNTSHTPE